VCCSVFLCVVVWCSVVQCGCIVLHQCQFRIRSRQKKQLPSVAGNCFFNNCFFSTIAEFFLQKNNCLQHSAIVACNTRQLLQCVAVLNHHYSWVPWLLHMCHDSLICAMTHSYVPWLIHIFHDSCICAMIHSYVPWFIYVCHDSFICAMTHLYVTWPMRWQMVSQRTHSVSQRTHSAQCVAVWCSVMQCVLSINWERERERERKPVTSLIVSQRKRSVCHREHVLPVTWPITTCYDSCICVIMHYYVPRLIPMCHDSSRCAMTHPVVPWLSWW